ncbi:hypothetical protein A3B50_04620 [Candidatus Roizmanbacteria bacterium RIFCSPLOWO2_01_FULL_40_42]|uniref:Shikimate kinase n=1 Tax=Candidatus Roizmanbacteria bacterium RIFCSPLOWO2_01_FULL_40_42 TaxID=1802066 RepID=A0A1F7J488_9BACT|nr:MAG: hypothetical protein A2779_00065 [Candidatus Roizmanbacteria bacterium RIFCSPHIGHO2_01_FULL_40_98]OGK28489.1 MAG: hypothetical protein A3C31_02840 [Candidatus Roizmanbacteria bacterium RIFCSPHIGHO2_02_FULL_40_53]OGK29380.1 MAG: hypothetical protein A2W49_00590 [Candidatus Roizmanbacteria bacterium RIFCSPHIGHO2_12_41_18]OGK36521.1 MAG: hypothetical protein A3E69_03055 [Candidatus Roizmanbacteria bacterium RIFCSPHIGHO2_12_FULL_40_130]OGK50406.1 MAG: hypothetical protein A3B50_04620 [Candi
MVSTERLDKTAPEKREVPSSINIIFEGYRGTGKSTIATLVAERLGRQLISTDVEVERREGRKISDMVAEFGWNHFRDRESEICHEASLMEGVVIDLGGGAVLREENRRDLKRNAVVILLTASNETIAERISMNDDRPSLTGSKSAVEEIADVMGIRGPIYNEMADHTISTDEHDIEESVQLVIDAVTRASKKLYRKVPELLRIFQADLQHVTKERNLPFQMRLATVDDIPALVPLICAAYLYENEGEMAFKQRERVRADAESVVEAMREGLVLVATKQGDEGEQIIGCMQYKEISSTEGSASGQETSAYFGLFAVDQRLQRGGIGRDMVGLAEWIAEARGRDLMEIQVVDKSTHLLDWYGKLGYEEFARVDWDAPFLTKACQFVLMQKHL